MSFAIPIPDWNSLDSVRHVHSELEGVALLFFALLVVFDVLSHLSKDDDRKRGLEKMALCFFAVAVLSEIVAYPYGQRNDTLSERIIGSLDLKAQRAADNASKAVTDSSTALSQAKDAADEANRAKGAATRATIKAGEAGNLARRVNDEAVVLTKRTEELQAQGVSLQKLINSGKEDLAVLKMPRTIENTSEWISSLRLYEGTEYTFSEVFPDAESIRLLMFIDQLLQEAGWKRVPLPAPNNMSFPIGIGLFGDCRKCLVPLSVKEGLVVEVEEPNPPSKPTGVSLSSLPEYVQAVEILWKEVFAGIFPRDGTAGSQYLLIFA